MTAASGAGIACQYAPGSARVGELKMEFLEGGRGAPLLYLHGLSRWLGWDTDHIGLALHRRVYAPTLPGWKAGRVPAQVAGVEDYARLMLAFIDAQNLGRTDLVAHSFGGWLALHMVLMAPEKVGRLVLVDTMGIDLPEAPAADISRWDENTLYDAMFATKTGVMVMAGDFGGVPLDLRGGALFKSLLNGQRNLTALTGGKCGERALMAQLGRISAETLIVWGETDGLTPLSHGRALAEHLGVPVVTIEGAGHYPQKEKPQTFLRTVCDFLSGNSEYESQTSKLKPDTEG